MRSVLCFKTLDSVGHQLVPMAVNFTNSSIRFLGARVAALAQEMCIEDIVCSVKCQLTCAVLIPNLPRSR